MRTQLAGALALASLLALTMSATALSANNEKALDNGGRVDTIY